MRPLRSHKIIHNSGKFKEFSPELQRLNHKKKYFFLCNESYRYIKNPLRLAPYALWNGTIDVRTNSFDYYLRKYGVKRLTYAWLPTEIRLAPLLFQRLTYDIASTLFRPLNTIKFIINIYQCLFIIFHKWFWFH